MINICEEYKNNINKMFGEIGSSWLERIPSLIDKYIDKFGLTNIKVNDNLTYNIIMFADSKDYGPVVFKIEIPFKEMTIRESVALELNNGIGACKCYYKDIDDGVLLIERLISGISLNKVDNLEERVKIFNDVLNRFSIEVGCNNELPLYKDILKRSTDMVYQDDKFEEIRGIVSIAEEMYEEIDSKGENNHLLHSDLFGDNIILSGNEWKSIDPHGFIGNKVLDTAIFIQKELDKVGYTKDNIDNMVGLVSDYCGYTKEEIAKALYVNYVLNICWDKEVNMDVTNSIEKSNIIREYIKSLDKSKTLCKNNK